jgi:hypothetical protein
MWEERTVGSRILAFAGESARKHARNNVEKNFTSKTYRGTP